MTALGAAEWRSQEAANERPLFTDPYAQLFLDEAASRGMSYSQYTDDMTAQWADPGTGPTRHGLRRDMSGSALPL